MAQSVILKPLRELCRNEDELLRHIVNDLPSMGSDLGFEVDSIEEEARVEGYLADRIIRCKDGKVIIVEAQLGESNHDHIGKLFTYMANKGADRGYLVCERARQEHINAFRTFGQGRLNIVEAYVVGGGRLCYKQALPTKSIKPGSPPPKFPYKEFWTGFKVHVLGLGLVEFADRNPHQNYFWTKSVGIPSVYWSLELGKDWVRVYLGSPPDTKAFREWKNRIVGYTRFLDRGDTTSFCWEAKVNGTKNRREDWPEFYKALADLYLSTKEASKAFLDYLREV